jgi:hypothetical protein
MSCDCRLWILAFLFMTLANMAWALAALNRR